MDVIPLHPRTQNTPLHTMTLAPARLPHVLFAGYAPGYYEGQPGRPTCFVANFPSADGRDIDLTITITCSTRMVQNFDGHTTRQQFVLRTTRRGDNEYKDLCSIYDCRKMQPNGKPSKKYQWLTPLALDQDPEYRLMTVTREFHTWLQDAFEYYGFFV